MTEPRETPDDDSLTRTLERVATRRLFDTSRRLMVERSPIVDDHKDGQAYTCDCCGRGARIESRYALTTEGACDCEQVWAWCENDDCEQVSWCFVDYTDCDYHGRTRAEDKWATLSPEQEVKFDEDAD